MSRPPVSSKPPKPARIMEKLMLLLTLFFFGGVAMYTFLPDGPVRGIGMGLFSTGIFCMMFKIK